MKKFILTICAVAIAATSFISCSKKNGTSATKDVLKIAMVTDSGDISDQSFNQTTFQACKEYADANGFELKYYKPSSDTAEARISSINAAIQDEYNVVVLPGYSFAEPVVKLAEDNDDVYFVCLDISEFDLMSAAEGLGKKIGNFLQTLSVQFIKKVFLDFWQDMLL